MVLLKIIRESFNQAFGQIIGNKLRSSLSLLGVTIGVVCIVGVQSMVASLETNVKSSIQKLGDEIKASIGETSSSIKQLNEDLGDTKKSIGAKVTVVLIISIFIFCNPNKNSGIK